MSTQNNNKNGKWDAKEIGALWTKISKDKSQKYMTGHINTSLEGKLEIVIFSNKDKKTDKSPDFRVYISERKKEAEVGASPSAKPKTISAPTEDNEEQGVL